MRITKFWFLLMAIAALAIVLAGCTKDGDPVKGNVAPDTRILSYVVSSAAELDTLGDPTNNYAVTVYWAGSDIDGNIKLFRYQDDAGNEGESTLSQEDFVYDFTNAGAEYTLQVTAVDNFDKADPTPAEIIIKRDFGGVETTVIDGPPNGAETSSAFRYKVGATSASGSISEIEYKVNDGDWTGVAVDENNEAEIDVIDAPTGGVVVLFRAVRDDGKVDETAASASVVVREGFFPTIINTSPVGDGGGWFAGVGIDFSWSMVMSYYYGIAPEDAWSYAFDDDTNFDDSADPLASGWTSEDAWYAADSLITAGTHTLYLKSRDLSTGKGLLSITFSVADFNPTEGIFVEQDFNWTGGYPGMSDPSEIQALLETGFLDGWSFTHNYNSALSPDDIGSYSSVVLYADNGYPNAGNGALFAAYGTAGGNLLITGYNLLDLESSFSAYGIYPFVFGYGAGNYGGMDGQAGTAYEGLAIDLPDHTSERIYQRVYDDQDNTQSIFAVRGLDGDSRSCGVRADMPNGNVVIVIGQSIPFWNQTIQDTKDLGDLILGTEFGETK